MDWIIFFYQTKYRQIKFLIKFNVMYINLFKIKYDFKTKSYNLIIF